MDEGGLSTDMVIIGAALLAIALTWEKVGDSRLDDGGYRDWVRLAFLAVLALVAIDGADHWREWLYALLMPAGAYYVTAAIVRPIAERYATRRG